jgi:hypothetical protein
VRFLEKLREKDASSAVAFHLEGLLDAADNVRALLSKLGEVSELNPESLAETISSLEVEVYSHLGYHMKELRYPLQRFRRAIYKKLERQGE